MTILLSRALAGGGFRHGFPTRETPDAELFAAVGHEQGDGAVIQVKQVHGARAVEASEAGGQEADALVSRAERAVGVRVADCVPVLVADPASGAVAAIHAGWRGVVGGVVSAGVTLLGGRPSGLLAAIGPCIGPCCFEVGPEVADAIGFVVRREGDRAYVDLRAAVRAQLRTLGLEDARVDDIAGCTKHEPARFHSFRRDGANSGRMLAVIAPRLSRMC